MNSRCRKCLKKYWSGNLSHISQPIVVLAIDWSWFWRKDIPSSPCWLLVFGQDPHALSVALHEAKSNHVLNSVGWIWEVQWGTPIAGWFLVDHSPCKWMTMDDLGVNPILGNVYILVVNYPGGRLTSGKYVGRERFGAFGARGIHLPH